jgi:2-keto-3-deoxy-L-rhamnonate aldolase RhmA
MRDNFVKKELRAGRLVIGASISIPDLFVVEIFGQAGFDFIVVDMEHSPISISALQNMLVALRSTESTVIVRAPGNDAIVVKQILDIGAEGVIVPDVSSREQCERAVGSARYAPEGSRGFGPRRAARLGGNRQEYLQRANDEILALIMVESQDALGSLDEILTTPGLDGVIIGPADLAVSMGYLLDQKNEAVEAAIDQIIAACQKHGVPFGTYTVTPENTAKWLAKGAQIGTMGTDVAIIDAGIVKAKSDIAAIRGDSAHG